MLLISSSSLEIAMLTASWLTFQAEFNAPVRTTKYPREIPPLPWYRQAVPQMLMAGFLPFSAIYIELYYIFASVWGHKASA